MIDNIIVQEGIDRVIQVCLRFISVCKLLNQQENNNNTIEDEKIGYFTKYNNGITSSSIMNDNSNIKAIIVVPLEEIEAINKDFISQISYLFTIMNKVDNRGFMFRLDFNNFFSSQI